MTSHYCYNILKSNRQGSNVSGMHESPIIYFSIIMGAEIGCKMSSFSFLSHFLYPRALQQFFSPMEISASAATHTPTVKSWSFKTFVLMRDIILLIRHAQLSSSTNCVSCTLVFGAYLAVIFNSACILVVTYLHGSSKREEMAVTWKKLKKEKSDKLCFSFELTLRIVEHSEMIAVLVLIQHLNRLNLIKKI